MSRESGPPQSNHEIHSNAALVIKALALGTAITVVVLLAVLAMKTDSFVVTMILVFAVAEVVGLTVVAKLIRRNEKRQIEELAERRREAGETVYPDVGV